MMADITVNKMLRYSSSLYGERVFTKNQPQFRVMQVMNMGKNGQGNIEEKIWTLEKVVSWLVTGLGISEDFKHINPENFERFIAYLFQCIGYNVQVTQFTGDYGADIIAVRDKEKLAIQVKKYKLGNDISNDEVRKAIGCIPHFEATGAVFVTTSDYTLQAKEQAKKAPIQLINGKQLDGLIFKYLIEPKLQQLKEGELLPPDIFKFQNYHLTHKTKPFGRFEYEIILNSKTI